jgi:hypothetical protein
MNREPVVTAVSIGMIVSAALGLLVVFGIPISNEQVEAILAFVSVVAPLALAALYARSRVSPVERPKRRTRKQPRNPNLRAGQDDEPEYGRTRTY